MSTTIKFGYIQFGAYKLFATPENYRLYGIGTKTQPVPRANGTILDVGYGYRGFNIKTYVQNAATVKAIDDYIQGEIASASPITVTDTLYPGGKTWSGFFELPVDSVGQVNANTLFGLPTSLMLDEISLTFYSIEEEVM